MKVLILIVFFSSIYCNSQHIIEEELDISLFDIFTKLEKHNIRKIDTKGDYFAKVIWLHSDNENSFDKEGHDKKWFYYILIADYGENPEGAIYKTIFLNNPKLDIRHLHNDLFEINITHLIIEGQSIQKRITLNSKGTIIDNHNLLNY